MKKMLFTLAFIVACCTLKANPVCYFTYYQAQRTVNYLNHQDELMIYCGYEYELESYVILSDVWAERIDPIHYEIWIYGYDAYTGEEVYTPVDLSCVWLFDRRHDIVFNAAKALNFQCDMPYISIAWAMPAYHGFKRVVHPAHYTRTYHYDVHRYGWRPATMPNLPVYYMRSPSSPVPTVVNTYVPGRERPVLNIDNQQQRRPTPTTSRSAATSRQGSSTTNSATTRPSATGSSTTTRPGSNDVHNNNNNGNRNGSDNPRPTGNNGSTNSVRTVNGNSTPTTTTTTTTTRPTSTTRPSTNGATRTTPSTRTTTTSTTTRTTSRPTTTPRNSSAQPASSTSRRTR